MGDSISKPRYIVAVAAGKGGVGKSTVAVNLALAFQKMGYSVGLLDADIYGPSLGKMLLVEEPFFLDPSDLSRIVPAKACGLHVLSLAHLRGESEALVVRAPIANHVITQFVSQVLWGELDYLFVDFPPGTGDVQLTMMQNLSFSGAVIVTQPQQISLIDVRKTIYMFDKMHVPILGVVENMAYFEDSSGKHAIFGRGGGKTLANEFGFPFLGEVPLDPELCACADQGKSFLKEHSQRPAAEAFCSMSIQIRDVLYEMECAAENYIQEFELVWKDEEK